MSNVQSIPRFSKKWFEVPTDGTYYTNDSTTNRDLIPVPPERRTWTSLGYVSYWVVEGVSITGYTTVSSMVGIGLSVRQSIVCAVIAGVIYGLMAVLSGWVGSHHHVGFPVFSRATFGMRAYYFPIVIRIITLIIWFGVQAYYGGQAIRVVISAIWPHFAGYNTFPTTKGNITTADFIGLVIYMILVIPCLLIPPERLQILLRVSFVMVFMSMMGMLIYAMKENGGPGEMFNSSSILSTKDLVWACIQGIFSTVGVAGTGIAGQSDWTRLAKTKNAPFLAQLLGAPIALTFSGIMGSLITSASNDLFGSPEWNPCEFLHQLQVYENNSPRARVGVFFAGSGFVAQQLTINILLNSVSAGMDMAGLAPKYLNIRRSSYIVAAISIACCPWFFQSDAKVVLIFGLGWGCFCSSFTGLMIAKYFLIYKRKVLISHLYIRDSSSIYWFWGGVDWRSVFAWVVSTAILMPGLAHTANNRHTGFWSAIFKVSYAWGVIVSAVILMILHYIFPDKDLPVNSELDEVYTPEGNLIEGIRGEVVPNQVAASEKSLANVSTICNEL